MIKLIMYTKVRRAIFPKNSPFVANRQFGENLVQNYATLYLMIVRKDFFKHLIMMKRKMWTKVTLFNFTQTVFFCGQKAICANFGQNYATLSLMINTLLHSHMTLTNPFISSYGLAIVIKLRK